MKKILTEEEQLAYDKKIENYFYSSDGLTMDFENKSYSLEERNIIYFFLESKIKNLNILKSLKINYLNHLENDLKKIYEKGEELSEDNYIEEAPLTFYNTFDKFKNLKISDKDFVFYAKKYIEITNQKINFLQEEILDLEKEKERFKPIEIKNGFYLIESLRTWLDLKDDNINHFNSVFIGEGNLLDKHNNNSVANLVPNKENKFYGEDKHFIATNGIGGRKGGLHKQEIIAKNKEEALLKLNKWAKENNERSWGIFKMTQPASFTNIREVEVIK